MKKIYFIFAVLMIFIAGATIVSATKTIQGYVVDIDKDPINNTFVELYNQSSNLLNSTNTDENGFYNMTYNLTASGFYILNFSKEFYVNTSLPTFISNNSGIHEINATLQEENISLGTINGTITNSSASNNTLENASIIVKIGESVSASTTTDSNGTYSATVSPGNYDVEVSYAGYMGQTKPATVTDGATTTINFELGTCSDGIKNQGEEGVDCGGPCAACEGNDNGGGGGGCTSRWICTEWSNCTVEGIRTRTCTDIRCGRTYKKPHEEEACIYLPPIKRLPIPPEENLTVEQNVTVEENLTVEQNTTVEENLTCKLEEEAPPTKGIIAITGRVIGGAAELGKNNLDFVVGLMMVLALIAIVIQFKMREKSCEEE